MSTHTHAVPAEQTAAVKPAKQQSSSPASASFVSNRPEAIAQRKLQATINSSPRVKQLKAYQQMANDGQQAKQAGKTTQRKVPVVQRVIDADEAYAVATHMLDQNATVKPGSLKTDSKSIEKALAFFDLTAKYTSTAEELALIKAKVIERKAEVQAEKEAAEEVRKLALNTFYGMDAVTARAHLGTLTAQQIADLGARAKIFRTYNTSWGLGSEYMFENRTGTLPQFVVHVHWNAADGSRSGVRLKNHEDKTRSRPGLAVLDDAKATALGIPVAYGETELLKMEKN